MQEPEIKVPPASDSVHVLLDQLDDSDENKTLVMPMVVIGINVYEVMLPFRRLWNYTLLAYGSEEHLLTETTELSNR